MTAPGAAGFNVGCSTAPSRTHAFFDHLFVRELVRSGLRLGFGTVSLGIMKRNLIAAALVASLVGFAALGFTAGRMTAKSEAELARIVEIVRVDSLVKADLASTNAITREAALWFQATSVQYGTDPLTLTLGEPGRTRELMLAYARIAEHAAVHQTADRTQPLMARSEEFCKRRRLDPCSRADILAFLKRLGQMASPPTQ